MYINAQRLFQITNCRYCHFKSNQHLTDSLAGRTDLDILVATADYDVFCAELRASGYLPVHSPNWNTYPGITDWVGYDQSSATFLHVHLHTQLLIGKKFVKEIHLPWEALFLRSRQYDAAHGLYVAEPNLELLLLLIRIGTKTTILQLLRGLRGSQNLPGNISDEIEFLLPQTDAATFKTHVQILMEPVAVAYGDYYDELQQAKQLSFSLQRRLTQTTTRFSKQHSRVSRPIVSWQYYYRALLIRSISLQKRLGRILNIRKTLPQEGVVVAVIGSDGSGKSTLVPKLQSRFSWKLETSRCYLGRHWLFPLVGRIKKQLRQKPTGATKTSPDPSLPTSLFTNLQHIMNARYRTRMLRLVAKRKARGQLVITDRWPQTQYCGINDSPSIIITAQSSWLDKRLARYEQSLYTRMTTVTPDLMLKLAVSPEVAQTRKPDHGLKEITRKTTIIEKLSFQGAVTHTLNTDTLTIAEVAQQAEQLVWSYLITHYESATH